MCAEQYEVAYRLRVVILHVVACLVSDIDMLFLCLVPHSGRFFWGVLGLEMYYRMYTNLLKIADLQAHNASRYDAL